MPATVVDLDAFDAFAADLLRRVLARPGFSGMLAYRGLELAY